MSERFNTYFNRIDIDFWRDLCVNEGDLRHYKKGEEFVSVGKVGRYIGYVKSGTLKYEAYSHDGSPHVIGLEFTGEFVTDFPFSLYGQPSRVSIVATSDCEIYCVAVSKVKGLMDSDPRIKDLVMCSTEAIFGTVYDRYISLYTQTPQERYNEMIIRHPDLLALFPLKDIASFLGVSSTHLSRLRKNI